MPIQRAISLWKRLTNAGRLLIFIPACAVLLACWAVSMLAIAVFYVGEGWVMRIIKRLDNFLVKDLE